MKTPILALLASFLLFSCSGGEIYRFKCKLNNDPFETDDTPVAMVTNSTLTITAFSGNSRFLLTAPYNEGQFHFSDTAGTEPTIQYWPDQSLIGSFYSTDNLDSTGYIQVVRITGTSVAGGFQGILHKQGEPDLVITSGDFFAQRP